MHNSEFARSSLSWLGAFLLLVTALVAKAAPEPTGEARSQLAPEGKLRVGLLVTNRSYVSKDGEPAEMQGVGVEIGRELAKQLGVGFEPVRYKSPASLLDGARKGEWDVSPIGYSAERTRDMDFTAIYAQGMNRYIVPTNSAIRNITEIDKPGHRITVTERSIQEAYLTDNLKHASVVRVKVASEALALMRSGKADAHFATGAGASNLVGRRPEFRLVDGGIRSGGSALAIAKGRPAGTAYAKAFIEHAKASGMIQGAIERTGLQGVSVAPAASAYY